MIRFGFWRFHVLLPILKHGKYVEFVYVNEIPFCETQEIVDFKLLCCRYFPALLLIKHTVLALYITLSKYHTYFFDLDSSINDYEYNRHDLFRLSFLRAAGWRKCPSWLGNGPVSWLTSNIMTPPTAARPVASDIKQQSDREGLQKKEVEGKKSDMSLRRLWFGLRCKQSTEHSGYRVSVKGLVRCLIPCGRPSSVDCTLPTSVVTYKLLEMLRR